MIAGSFLSQANLITKILLSLTLTFYSLLGFLFFRQITILDQFLKTRLGRLLRGCSLGVVGLSLVLIAGLWLV